MKGITKALLPVLAGVMALTLTVPAFAQDATATPDASGSATTGAMGTLNCDSSVILLAGLAQRFFGFAPTDVTLGDYVYGQYSPLFDNQSSMEPSSEATADVSAEATADMSSEATVEANSDLGENPTLVPNSVFLNPPVIADEDPSCTQLRTSLESFFSTKLQSSEWDADFRNGMNSNSTGG